MIESGEDNSTVRKLIGHERPTKSGRMNLKTRFVEWKKKGRRKCALSANFFRPSGRRTESKKQRNIAAEKKMNFSFIVIGY